MRDFIIDNKRAKRDLTMPEAIAVDSPGKMCVNKLIPLDAYNLFKRTKAKAAATAHRIVWTHEGNILIHRTATSTVGPNESVNRANFNFERMTYLGKLTHALSGMINSIVKLTNFTE